MYCKAWQVIIGFLWGAHQFQVCATDDRNQEREDGRAKFLSEKNRSKMLLKIERKLTLLDVGEEKVNDESRLRVDIGEVYP